MIQVSRPHRRERIETMAKFPSDAEYPIAAVSKLTGVSCHALRVWERRYGFPVPLRAPSGHRRYRHEQVVILRRLSELSREGRSIGDLMADVQAGRLQIESDQEPTGTVANVDAALADMLDRLQQGDLAAADDIFDRLQQRLGPVDLANHVIGPALTETGERWFRRRCSVYQERCVSGFLRRKLGRMIDEARRTNPRPARSLLIGTVQGDRHEGGVLIVHLLLERAGWGVLNLGVDLPVSEFERAVSELQPQALALSFVLSRNINKRFQELSRLRSVPVFVGGRSILNYQKLARRHGLIPVAGPAATAVESIDREYEAWLGRKPAPGVAEHVSPASTAHSGPGRTP
jgi:methanogenic corrinoid protein MtbC1